MARRTLNVHFLPAHVDSSDLGASCVIVIDVLRATTTIVQALAQGATCILPCLSIEAARAEAVRMGSDCRLAGERGGLPIEGFDLGNSPREFTASTVGDRPIVMTTTNGTVAMEHCCTAPTVLVAAFANLSAVAQAARDHERVDIVCAGTGGRVTREDVLLAGALVVRLNTETEPWHVNDSGWLAAAAWQQLAQLTTEVLADTQGGRDLTAIGMDDDLAFAARCDTCQIVPRRSSDGSFRVDNAG